VQQIDHAQRQVMPLPDSRHIIGLSCHHVFHA
jgi:hypothetical protein